MKKVIFICIVFLVSCTGRIAKTNDDDILAKVHGTYLYSSDLNELVPEGTSVKDSIIIVKNYINKWVQQQLIVQQATKNLTDEQLDFSKQLRDYRYSLIIYKYENQLIIQNLDTIVADKEIESYYESNKQNFELKNNIVIAHYVVLSLDSIQDNPVKDYMTYSDSTYIDKLEDFCKRSAYEYFLEDNWVEFSDLLSIIPFEVFNEQDFLTRNNYFETQDSLYKYFVKINDFKIKESVSPLAFEKENITNIIINKRKLRIIEDMRNELYRHALENGDFEIY